MYVQYKTDFLLPVALKQSTTTYWTNYNTDSDSGTDWYDAKIHSIVLREGGAIKNNTLLIINILYISEC